MSTSANTRPGRFWLRFSVIATSLAVFLIIAGSIAIPRLIDVNTYRSMIESWASQRLGRPVALGRMELVVFPQLSAVFHDVTVGGLEIEGKTVLSASAVRARARLFPLLLSRRLEVTALQLEEPDLALIRDASGKWNWELMAQRKEPESAAPRLDREKWAFTVGDLRIDRGKIRVVDDAAEPGQSLTFGLVPVDLDVHGYHPGRAFDLDMDGMMVAKEGQGELRFRGKIGPLPVPFDIAKLPLDGTIRANAFPLHSILPYVRSEDGVRSLGGSVTSDLLLEIQPGKETRAKGSLTFDKVLLALGGASPRSVGLDFEAQALDLTSTDGGKNLDLRELNLALPGGSLLLKGKVRDLGTESGQLELNIDGRDVNINDVAPLATLVGADLPLEAVGSQRFDAKGLIETQMLPGVRKLHFRDLRLNGIEAALYRDSDGSWSPGRTAPVEKQVAARTHIEVENLRIERANLLIEDAVAGHGRPAPLRLTDVDLKVDHYGTGAPARGSLAANLAGGGRAELSGTVGPEANGQLPVDAQVRLEQAKVSTVRQYLPGLTGLESGDGTVDLNASVRGRTPERLALAGTLGLRDVEITMRKTGGGTERQVLKGDVVFDGVSENGGERLTLRSCKVSLPSGTFVLSGSLARRDGGTLADITLAPTRVKVEDLQSLTSLFGLPLPGTLRSPNPIEVALHASGDLADRRHLQLEGSLRTTNMTWESPYLGRPLENVGAKIRFTGDGFESKGFSATLGETALQGDLEVHGLGEPDVIFAIRSDRANLSQMLSALSGGQSQTGGESAPDRAGKDSMAKLKGRGSIALRTGTFNTLSFSDLRGTVTLVGKVLRVAPLHFGLYRGSYDGEVEIDLLGDAPLFKYNGTLAGVDAHEFFSTNTDFKDALYGTLSGRVSVAGRGTTMDEIIRGMEGSGELTIKDGKLERLSMLKGLSDVSGLFGESTIAQISHKMVANQTPFSELAATFRVGGGRAAIDRLLLQSTDLAFRAKGGFGFDGRLGLNGRLVFSEVMTRSLKAEKSKAVYLGAERGLVAIPLIISGSIDRPSFAVDFGKAAEYAVEKSIADKLTETLFPKKKEPPPEPAPTPAKTVAPADSAGAGNAETPPSGGAPGAAPPADLQVRVDSHRFRGNVLQPDLAVKGSVSGSHLASLLVVVTDERKHEVHRDKLLTQEIATAYGARPRSEPLTVPFDFRIAGTDLPPLSKSVTVKLTAVSDGGATASVSFSEKKPLARLF